MQHEIELKLRIPATAASKLLRHPALERHRRGPARRATLRSVYFDTADLRLAEAGVAVRLRQSGHEWLQAIKGSATAGSGGGLAERVECEWRLRRASRRPPLDLAKFVDTPYRRVIERATRRASLVPLFTTDYVRITVALAFDDSTTARLCLDQGVIHAGERARGAARVTLSELELELEAGSTARLFELAAALSVDLPLTVETRSKAERGYDLVAHRRAIPLRAAAIPLAADASVASALALIARSCLRHIEANADGVGTDDDPEWIHQMRVGVRRLRSVLALARTALPPGTIAPLEDELRWLAKVLGRSRDLDVLRIDTLPAIAQASLDGAEHRITVETLAGGASSSGVAARAEARAAVASQRFARLQLATAWLAALPLLGAGEGSPEGEALAGPVRPFATAQLKRRHRQLIRTGEHLADGTSDERHRVRIAAKKTRYAAEFFASLYSHKRTRAYSRALARLQEELGGFNDASVAAAMAAELCGATSPAAALVAGWAGARVDAREPAILRAWHGFTKVRPFWLSD